MDRFGNAKIVGAISGGAAALGSLARSGDVIEHDLRAVGDVARRLRVADDLLEPLLGLGEIASLIGGKTERLAGGSAHGLAVSAERFGKRSHLIIGAIIDQQPGGANLGGITEDLRRGIIVADRGEGGDRTGRIALL